MTEQPSVEGLIARLEAATEGGVQLDCLIADVANRPPFPFTTSLDAALTLVPDRHRWLLDKRPGAYFRSDGYRAEVYREAHSYRSDRSDVPMHWGTTPALALCIAALKAHLTYPQTVDGDHTKKEEHRALSNKNRSPQTETRRRS